jgi:hypothetical protein
MIYTQFSTQMKFCLGGKLFKFVSNIQRGAIVRNVEGDGGNICKKGGIWGRRLYKTAQLAVSNFCYSQTIIGMIMSRVLGCT